MTSEATPRTANRATGAAFDLDRALELERERVEEALRRSVDRLTGDLAVSGVADALAYGVLTGGKRIRPILCAAAFTASGGRKGSPIYDVAVSLELIHAYSLMHDDLPCMDHASLRRGRATTHVAHGESRAMVAGAALIPAATLQAWEGCEGLSLDGRRTRKVIRTLLGAAGAAGMVGGQALDLFGEERTLGEEEVAVLHRMKTGALLAAAPTMGGTAAAADDDTVTALRDYGVELGLAFQIADDVLDATGSAESLGKVPSDADLDKSTYVSRFGVDGARARARECATRAVASLERVGLASPLLAGIAEYVVRRDA